MRTQRRRPTARTLLALAVVLGSLWAGGVAASAVGDPAGGLTGGRPRAAVEAAVLRDRALGPASERPGPRGHPLLVTLVAALAVARWRAVGVRLHPAAGRPPVRSAPLGARSPPHLQPA